ncbi:MAG: DUF4271 domain-containing protein, partial [Flavobacterium sp.]|nr:DUF4271 domain-containing protein [Flavobacterium sp.]
MNDYLLQPRSWENTDWAVVVILLALTTVAATRSVFEKRFSEFVKLGISDKYTKIYRDNSHMMSWFNVSLFAVNLISFAFLIQLILSYAGYAEKSDWVLYIRIITLLGVFIICKYLIEKIIAICFNVEEFVEQFNLQKVSYRTYIGLIILPVVVVLYYNDFASKYLIYSLITAILAVNGIIYLFLLKNYQNMILGKLSYFILYLCALEIAP